MDDWLQQFLEYYQQNYPEGDWATQSSEINPYLTRYGTEANPGIYGYQDISPEVMGALSNVFRAPQGTPLESWDFTDWEGDPIDLIFGGSGEGLTQQIDPESPFYNIEDFTSLTNIFDPASIANTLSNLAGTIGTSSIRPGEVTALTPEMLKKTTQAHYEPYETSEREGLVEKLGKARGKVKTGGFAGSGARAGGMSSAEDVYRGGYTDLLKDIMKMRGKASEDVMEKIYGWQELLAEQ